MSLIPIVGQGVVLGTITYLLAMDHVRPVVLWPLVALAVVCGATLMVVYGRFVLRNRARSRALHAGRICRSCGYDRVGLPVGAPCPECGNA